MAPSPSRPASTSKFLALPAELRFRIYDHVLSGPAVHHDSGRIHTAWVRSATTLILTNRQMREEATKPLFHRITGVEKEFDASLDEFNAQMKKDYSSGIRSYSNIDEYRADVEEDQMREQERDKYREWQERVVQGMRADGFAVDE